MPGVTADPKDQTASSGLKREFNLEITSTLTHSFELAEKGLFIISIKASGKPGWKNRWWLNFKGVLEDYFDLHLDDDDLRIEIDDLSFTKPDGRKGLFNSPAAFSGTKTLGKTKTVIFVLRLAAGSHRLKFIPDGSPYLESVSVEKSADEENVHFALKTVAENENYYSWYTFAVINDSLKSIRLEALAANRQNDTDDDDLKIIVDGQVQKNPANRHKDSYFCGFSQKGILTTFNKDFGTGEKIYYLELCADKTPTLHSVKLTLAPSGFEVPKTNIRIYRPGPKGENFNRFDEVIRYTVDFWNTDFLSQNYPPPKPLDPNLVKAMIYVESEVGYGFGKNNKAYPDVMQVGNKNDPAIHTLNNDGWVDPQTGNVSKEYEWRNDREKVLDYKGEAGVETPEQSIKWGVRWLYHKAQEIRDGKGYWRSWERAVEGYNGGGDPNYLKKVYGIYRNGINFQGKKLWSILLLTFFALIPSALAVSFWLIRESRLGTGLQPTTQLSRDDSRKTSVLGETARPIFGFKIKEEERLDSENRLALIWHTVYPAIGLGVVDNFGNVKYFLEGNELKEEIPGGEINGPGEYTDWLMIEDLNGDQSKEIAIQYIVSGTGSFRPLYVYSRKEGSFKLLLKLINGVSNGKLIDLDQDGTKEIFYSYSLDASGAGPRSWTVWKEIWGWQDGELELVSHRFPAIYKNLILFYDHLLTDPDPDSWLKSYYPMIECLKVRAKTNISGALADVKTCRDT